MKRYSVALIVLLLAACHDTGNKTSNDKNITDNSNPPPASIGYSIVKIYPHDTGSYTEGLIWHNNTLYESTGNEGHSKLAKINIETGKPMQEVKITDPAIFGEGITIFNNKIYQLTWKSHIAYVYDLNSFKKIGEFNWPYDEAWAITNNGKDLIISTGSSNLYYVDPDNFKVKKTVGVTNNYGPVPNINELEYINGFVFANQFETDNILKIDPETGHVVGLLDMTGLLAKSGMPFDPSQYNAGTENVLNGIAYDSAKNSLYVTGKDWPALFEIKLN